MRADRRLTVSLSAALLLLGCGGQPTKADEPPPAETKPEEKAPPPEEKPGDKPPADKAPADKPADKPAGAADTKPLDPTPGTTGAPGPAPLQKPGEHPGGLGGTKPGVPDRPIAQSADGKDKDKPAPRGPQKDERAYLATVTDRFGTKPFAIADALLWVPEVSIFGGESGDERRSITLKHGAAEIEVPFAEIASIAIREVADDRLPVTITFRATDRTALEGTVKANLQLRGRYEKTELRARLKFRDLTELKLEESKGPR